MSQAIHLSETFFEHLHQVAPRIENREVADKLPSLDWNKRLAEAYEALIAYWEKVPRDVPVGVVDALFDDAGTGYMIELDRSSDNDPETAFEDGCIINEPVIDFGPLLQDDLGLPPQEAWSILDEDYALLLDILFPLAMEALRASLDSEAFKALQTTCPHYVTFSYSHDDDAPLVLFDSNDPQKLSIYPEPQAIDWSAFDEDLTYLELTGHALHEVPKELEHYATIKSLYLSNNQIRRLACSPEKLPALTSIHLDGNTMTELPPELLKFTRLNFLGLGGNYLTRVPKAVEALNKLENLSLNNNRLTEFEPTAFAHLSKLDIGDNRFARFPQAVCELHTLTSLDARGNRFTTLPPCIGQLKALEALRLFDTPLEALPSQIEELQSLQTLALSGSQLETLPDEICQLKALKDLDLKDSPLTQLPENLGDLGQLKYLDLSNTPLHVLPDSIERLTSLKRLDIRGTKISQARVDTLRKQLPACKIKFEE